MRIDKIVRSIGAGMVVVGTLAGSASPASFAWALAALAAIAWLVRSRAIGFIATIAFAVVAAALWGNEAASGLVRAGGAVACLGAFADVFAATLLTVVETDLG